MKVWKVCSDLILLFLSPPNPEPGRSSEVPGTGPVGAGAGARGRGTVLSGKLVEGGQTGSVPAGAKPGSVPANVGETRSLTRIQLVFSFNNS